MIVILTLFACTEDEKNTTVDDTPQSPFGHLKIEEVYYAGSIPTEGIERYYSDQFIQLRNTSEYTLDIGGLGIGDVFGVAGEINSGYEPDGFADDADNVYLGNLWQIPMDSQYRYLEPGGCIKIAHDAADHSPYSSFSHFDAHFETYVEEYDRDTDDPIVENLSSIFYSGGYDWLITVFGPSIVIVDSAAVDDGEAFRYRGSDMWKTPSEHVIDTMEAVMNANSGNFKRLHSSLDSGFQYVSGTYTGESVRRVMENGRLIDTDNSTEDYYVTEAIGDCGTGL